MDKKYIIRSNDGQVDYNKSSEAYVKALRMHIEATEIGQDLLDKAIDAVFAENKDNERLPKAGLVTLAISKLNLAPSQIGMVQDRMNKYIASSDRFDCSKGKGGGILLRRQYNEPVKVPEVSASNG